MAVVERLKKESMHGLSAKKNGRYSDVAVTGGSTAKLNLTLQSSTKLIETLC